MEILGYLISFFLLALIVSSPIYFGLFKYGFIKSLFASLVVCSVLVVSMYWGSDAYIDLRLNMLGYDLTGMSDAERIQGVALEKRQEANQLYQSRFGVGWPLKAVLALSIFVSPYILIVLTMVSFYKKWHSKNSLKKSST